MLFDRLISIDSCCHRRECWCWRWWRSGERRVRGRCGRLLGSIRGRKWGRLGGQVGTRCYPALSTQPSHPPSPWSSPPPTPSHTSHSLPSSPTSYAPNNPPSQSPHQPPIYSIGYSLGLCRAVWWGCRIWCCRRVWLGWTRLVGNRFRCGSRWVGGRWWRLIRCSWGRGGCRWGAGFWGWRRVVRWRG